jgi:hypothetical protein
MSDFNTANELAAELIRGRTYQGDDPCPKLAKIVFRRDLDDELQAACIFTGTQVVVVEDDGQIDWATAASRINILLNHGYTYTTEPERIGDKFEVFE